MGYFIIKINQNQLQLNLILIIPKNNLKARYYHHLNLAHFKVPLQYSYKKNNKSNVLCCPGQYTSFEICNNKLTYVTSITSIT